MAAESHQGREQWGPCSGKTALQCSELPNRGRGQPWRAKDQRQTQIRSYTNATPGSNLGKMERGPRVWVTGPVDTIGKDPPWRKLEKNKTRNNFKASQSKRYKKDLRAKSKPQDCLRKPPNSTTKGSGGGPWRWSSRGRAWPGVGDQGCPSLQPIELPSSGSPGVHFATSLPGALGWPGFKPRASCACF